MRQLNKHLSAKCKILSIIISVCGICIFRCCDNGKDGIKWLFRYNAKFAPSCSSVVDSDVKPEAERSKSVSGEEGCVRLGFIIHRPTAFYCMTLLVPVGLCTLPLLALLAPRPSRDAHVTADVTGGGGRLLWRVPALLALVAVFIFQLHFVSSRLQTRLSLIGKAQIPLRRLSPKLTRGEKSRTQII